MIFTEDHVVFDIDNMNAIKNADILIPYQKKAIVSLLNSLSFTMFLHRLEKIFVTTKFKESMNEYRQVIGLADIEITSEFDYFQGLMMVNDADPENIRHAIVLPFKNAFILQHDEDIEWLAKTTGTTKEEMKRRNEFSKHILIHELAHVHDYEILSFKKFILRVYSGGYMGTFANIAISMWKEFYADRYPTAYVSIQDIRTQDFEEVLEHNEDKIILNRYYYEHKGKSFQDFSIDLIEIIRNNMVQLVYYFAWLNIPERNSRNRITLDSSRLRNLRIASYFEPIYDALEILYNTYSKWSDYTQFATLTVYILKYIESFGITFKYQDGISTVILVDVADLYTPYKQIIDLINAQEKKTGLDSNKINKGDSNMLKRVILQKLKDNLVRQGKINANDFIQPSDFESNEAEFYLNEIEKNLINPMSTSHIFEYNKGNGHEFFDNGTPAKMKSLHSSSAMTFNLLGNGPIEISTNHFGIKGGNYHIKFEKKLSTLKKSGSPANLDAFLLSLDWQNAVFCEMKMFEWFEKNHTELPQAYHQIERYYDFASFSTFNSAFIQLINSGFSRYDAFQMMKHALGIYNSLYAAKVDSDNPLSMVKDVTLLNCVWEVTDPKSLGDHEQTYQEMVAEEHGEYEKFKVIFQEIVQLFKDELKVNLNLVYMNHNEFIGMLVKSPQERDYLKRYEV